MQIDLNYVKFKGELHSKIISSDFFRRIWWWRSGVKIWTGRWSNRRQKCGTSERLWHQWWHLVIIRGHASDSKCSWSAGISWYRRPAVVNRIRGRTQDHSAASNSWCLVQWRTTGRVFVTQDFLAIFGSLFDSIPVRIWHRTLTIEIYEKKQPTRSELMILEYSFPLLWNFYDTAYYRQLRLPPLYLALFTHMYAPLIHKCTHTSTHRNVALISMYLLHGNPV